MLGARIAAAASLGLLLAAGTGLAAGGPSDSAPPSAPKGGGRSATSSWIAFLSTRTGKKVNLGVWGSMGTPPAQVADVFVVRPDGSGEKQISDDQYVHRFSHLKWAPTAPLLAWVGEKGLMVTDLAAGSERVVLPQPPWPWPPRDVAWGPAGDKLALLSATDLEIYDLAGKRLAQWQVPQGSAGRLLRGVAWSSQGYLAVASRKQGVWVTTDSTKLSGWRLVAGDLPTLSVGWSPDGQTLLLVRDEPVTEDSPRIWLAKADGSGLRRLHPTATRGESAPALSPDGKKIAFVTGSHGHERVYVSELDGSSERDLTPTDTWADHPTWSPDSTEIAFHAFSYADGARRIYAADITGTPARCLPGSKDDFKPVWSPAY